MAPGDTIGHYEILGQVGAGGMGVVYRARDLTLDRTVAVKVVTEGALADPAARDQLLHEARTASALNHPNICTIYGADIEGEQPYVAMEFLDGQTLRARIPADGMAAETVCRYGAQIASALSHAHARRVVHRDLKPANVMITPEGQVKVLDFGLARRTAARAPEATRSLGDHEQMAGTLAYMAPEVLQGQAADEASDIWALGVVLQEAVTGEAPFRGETSFTLTSAILREPAAPLPPRVPVGLRSVIQKCLAKNPGERYGNAGEVRAALEMVAPEPFEPPVRRLRFPRRWLWAAAVAILVALAGALFRMNRPSARLSNGGKPSSNAEANEYFERGMLFSRTSFDLPRMTQMFEKALSVDPEFAEARAEYGFAHYLMIDSGASNDPRMLYKAEEELRRAAAADPSCGRAHSALAAVYLVLNRKDLFLQEIETAKRLQPGDLDIGNWMGNYYWYKDEYAAAEKQFRDMLRRNPLFFPARMNLGEMAREQGNLDVAITEHRKILEQDPKNLFACAYLARALIAKGDPGGARAALSPLSEKDGSSFFVRAVLVHLAAAEGRREEVGRLLDEPLFQYAALGPFVTLMIAEAYAITGDTEKALDWLDRTVRAGDERASLFRRAPMLASLRGEARFRQIVEAVEARRSRPR